MIAKYKRFVYTGIRMRSAQQSGQALVIILLSLAVVLTLVLFILSRTVVDISVSTDEEEAIRAFSAAEAGVEKALIVGSVEEGIGDASFEALVSGYEAASPTYNFLFNLNSGDVATVWLATNDGNGGLTPYFNGDNIKVCWGEDNTPIDQNTPAIEVSTFYRSGGNVLIRRTALDPNLAGRSPSNSFNNAPNRNCTIEDKTYEFWSNVVLPASPNELLFARIRMLYNANQDQILGVDVSGEGLLPSQGKRIDSVGQSGESERRLEVFQLWPEPPPIFDFVVFSATNLVQ